MIPWIKSRPKEPEMGPPPLSKVLFTSHHTYFHYNCGNFGECGGGGVVNTFFKPSTIFFTSSSKSTIPEGLKNLLSLKIMRSINCIHSVP